MSKWRVLKGSELLGECELPASPTEEGVLTEIKRLNIDLPVTTTIVDIKRSVIFITGKNRHFLIDLMKVN